MKYTFYTFLLIFIFSSSNLFSQTIPNGGFDNWSDIDLFEVPPPYNSTNFQTTLLGGNPAVTQVQGVTGSAARLESVMADGEIIPGVLALADLIDDINNGIPFSSNPDSVIMQLRYDIPMGDSAVITFVFTNGGTPSGFLQIPLTGTQNDFAEFKFNVPPILGVPDSLIFIAASSSFDDPILGGFLEIDDIVFTGSNEQLPNNDFEIWDAVESSDPDGWSSFNVFQSLFDLTPMVTETSDAVSGSAVRIETVEFVDFDNGGFETIGFLASGDIFSEEPSFAVNGQPEYLSGYYKFSTSADDSAAVFMEFTQFNFLTGESETVGGFLFYWQPTSTYTPFNFPLNFPLGANPDSVRIIIAAFDAENLDDDDVPLGNVLHLDELTWDFLEGVKVPVFSDALELFPNPAREHFFIKTQAMEGIGKTIQLTDLAVRVVLNTDIKNLDFGNGLVRLDVKDLDSGMYFYKILTDESAYSGKVMIKK